MPDVIGIDILLSGVAFNFRGLHDIGSKLVRNDKLVTALSPILTGRRRHFIKTVSNFLRVTDRSIAR